MKSVLKQLPFILALAILAGCGKPAAPAPSPSDAVLAVVRNQADALNRKDLDAVMVALDPTNPGYEQTKQMTAKVFGAYDLHYTLNDLAVESITGDEAHVRFSQTTEKVSGPAFRNNRVEGEHVLKKLNGAWKITSTQANKVEYLDKQQP